MINNFEPIKKIIADHSDLSDDDTFLFCQIMQRRKENPYILKDNHVIKDYYIDSIEKLDDKKDEIIKLCEVFNGRAYIHLNTRSYKDVSFECLRNLADRFLNSAYKANKGIWATSCGRKHSDKNKKWVVDLDFKDMALVDLIKQKICECDPIGDKILAILQTKNGFHLITKPFNKNQFNEWMCEYFEDKEIPEHSVQTNNPCLLYI